MRYFIDRGSYRKSAVYKILEDDLHVSLDGTHWMNDYDEFKRKYPLDILDKIIAVIETNDVFKKGTHGPCQMPVKHQLMVLLQFLGKEGESNDSQRNVFKFSYGQSEICRKRVGRLK